MTGQMDKDGESQVPSVFKRKLDDVASTASIDIVSLNNVIVKMRPKVRASKRVVISKLRDVIKKLKNMKGTDAQKQKNEKKASDREKEIVMIKALQHDHVSKFAIGSTDKIETVFSRPNVSMEQIALVRLSGHKFIQDIVQDFRKNHSDWKELGAYLMTKHTNREFKKKKKKPDRLTMQMKELKKLKTKARVEASETMVKSYLNEKLRNEDVRSESEEGDDVKADHVTVISGSDEGDADSDNEDSGRESSGKDEEEVETVVKASKVRTDKNLNSGSDDDDDVEEEEKIFKVSKGKIDKKFSNDSELQKMQKGKHKPFNNVIDDDFKVIKNKEKGGSKTKVKEKQQEGKGDKGNTKMEKNTKKDKAINKDSSSKDSSKTEKNKKQKESLDKKTTSILEKVKVKPKPKTLEKKEGEIIVKKLNLDEWCSMPEPKEDKSSIPELLLANGDAPKPVAKENNEKSKKKSKDPFFDTGERLFQTRDSQPVELGKNLLAFAGYDGKTGTEEEADGNLTTNSGRKMNQSDDDDDVDVDDDIRNDSYSNRRFGTDMDEGDFVFSEKSRRDGSVYMKANNIGKQAFRSTFMGSLSYWGPKDFSKKKFNKKDKNLDREKGNNKFNKALDGKKGGNTVSAGTKAKLKKKDMYQKRDSRPEELGSSLLTIAGYDRDGSKSGKSVADSGVEKGSFTSKGDNYRGRKDNLKEMSKAKPTKPAQSIHPSWEASLKRKKQQQAGKVKFTGKKIKFDDD